jgi:3D (Asp-Asp-Asp) domain-containing protein
MIKTEGNDWLPKLEKYVCATYICLAIVIGGFSAYFKVILDDTNNLMAQKDDNLNKSQGKLVSTAPNYRKQGEVVNIDSNLCIREEPNLDSSVSYCLYKGMMFDILEKNDGWYKIKYEDITGYGKEDYVREYNGTQNNLIFNNLIKKSTPIEAELTAYCNCEICSEAWGSQTSMQTHTRVGVIAAPKDIPLGSKIYIPELKDYKEDAIFNVEDRGGAVVVKSNGTHIIDIWLPTHEQVEEFGRKKVMVCLMT